MTAPENAGDAEARATVTKLAQQLGCEDRPATVLRAALALARENVRPDGTLTLPALTTPAAPGGGAGMVKAALAKIDEARISIWKSYRHLAARDVALLNDAYDAVSALSSANDVGCGCLTRCSGGCDNPDPALSAAPAPAGENRAAELEAVLVGLCSYFGAGMPSEPLAPASYDKRIREGVELTYAPMVEAWQRSLSEGKP